MHMSHGSRIKERENKTITTTTKCLTADLRRLTRTIYIAELISEKDSKRTKTPPKRVITF